MARIGFTSAAAFMLFALSLFPAGAPAATKTAYIGGSMALTGAYSQDVAALLAGFEDYVRYVNERKSLAPWLTEKFPADVNLELLWRDDELKPAKALTIYEELKAKGMLVFRVSGSPQALALKDKLKEDSMGTTTFASGPFLLKPPGTILTYLPLYTDSLAGVADWFKENWKEARKPRVAYLTADNAMGKAIEVPEMQAYLKQIGYDFVGIQYVPVVATAPPTTQLMWLKEKGVDLALGVMILPGAQPTVKEMVRLGMGPHLEVKMTFACPNTTQVTDFAEAMGDLGVGFAAAASCPPWSDLATPGVRFANDLQNKYRQNKRVANITYEEGIIEAMTQTEALRLAMKETPFEKLTRADVLNNGFYKIRNLDTGGLASTPLTYGPGKVEGVDKVRVYQVQKGGSIVKLGLWPCRHIYTK